MTVTIWHNPRCSKSRETLKLLEERGVEPEVRLYLDNAPDVEEIKAALEATGLKPIEMMRPKEAAFREQGLEKSSPDDLLIAAMAAEPKLIERPIVFNGKKAALGRPPHAVLGIL